MIATLILSVCLISDPSICEDVSPPLDPGLFCPVQGEIVVQAWLDEHPKWMRKAGTGWKCQIGLPEQKA